MARSASAALARAYSPMTSLVLDGLMFFVVSCPATHSPAMKFWKCAVMPLPCRSSGVAVRRWAPMDVGAP
jgi:hypothetical protein